MAEEKQLRILIETILDERGAKAAAESLTKVKEQAKGVGEETRKTTGSFDGMGKGAMSALGTISKLMVMVTAATAPMVISARQYAQYVGQATSTSREWLKTEYELKQVQKDIGEVNAKAVLPFMEKYVELSGRLRDIAKSNPGLFVAGEAGAGLLGSGVAISMITRLLSRGGGGGGLSGLLGLGGSGGINGLGGVGTSPYGPAPSGAVGAGSTGTVASVMAMVASTFATVGLPTLIVSGGMKALMNYIVNDTEFGNKLQDKSQQKSGLTDEQLAQANKSQNPGITAALLKYQNQTGATDAEMDKSPKWVKDLNAGIRKLFGVSDSDTPATDNKDGKGEFLQTQTLQKMRQYQIQERYAQEDYDRQRFVANRDFNRQLVYSEQDFYRQRGYSLRDFNINFAFTEKMFYLQRSIALRDFNISLSRSEYDYALSRQRAQEDHNFSLKQIMLSGDALQYYYSQRQFNIDKRRAEEDYQRQRQRSIDDFNRQQNDSLYQFGLQRAQSVLQFNIQLADSQKEFEIQRERQKVQFGIQLDDMDFQYRRERTRRWEGFTESILPEIMQEDEYRALMEKNLTITMINNFNTLMSKFASDYNGFILKYLPTGTSTGGVTTGGTGGTTSSAGHHFTGQYAEGGYTKAGIAELHDSEFVLNPSTTKVAEAAARGTLTQEKIIAALTTGNSGMQYVDNRQFSRGLTPEEKIIMRHETQQFVLDAFGR